MPDRLGVFLTAALILLLIPGPAVLYISARGIDQGRWAGVLSAWGVELANLVHAIAAGVGLSAILATSAIAFSLVRYIGAAYLIYLGLKRLLGRDTEHQLQLAVQRLSLRRTFTQGFALGLLNPKTALFFLAFLPQFVNPSHGEVRSQLFLLGFLFVALGMCTDTGYGLLSGTIGRWLRQRLRQQRNSAWAQRYLVGGTYLGLGMAAAISAPGGRPDALLSAPLRGDLAVSGELTSQ